MVNGKRITLLCTIIMAIAAILAVPWEKYTPRSDSASAEITQALRPSQPSIDCDKAVTWAEISICSEQRLARLDQKLNEKFYNLYRNLDRPRKRELQMEQRLWISNMSECEAYGDGIDCLIRKYSGRLQTLDRRLHATKADEVN